MAHRAEDEGQREALGLALHEDDLLREEHLAPLVVEGSLDAHPLGVAQDARIGAPQCRPLAAQVEPRDLLVVGGVDQVRRPGRVDDLVAHLGEAAQERIEVPLGLRREEQLRFLDQQHLAAGTLAGCRFERRDGSRQFHTVVRAVRLTAFEFLAVLTE